MEYLTKRVNDAVLQLVELREGSSQDDGYRFALAWLSGARMSQLGMLPEGSRLISLADQETWTAAHPVVGKLCAEIIWPNEPLPHTHLEITQAIRIIGDLVERSPEFHLSVPDALWHVQTPRKAVWPVLSPEACDLLFSILGAERGAKVWIPFDPVGQLTSRAMKLGLEFELAGPPAWASDFQRLSRAVLGIFDESAAQAAEASRRQDGRSDLRADYLLAVPPIASKIPVNMEWHQWEEIDESLARSAMLVRRAGVVAQLRLDRVDAWAPAALWPRINRRAVFMTAQSLLFARGQEQRLREAWVRGKYPIDTVLALPGRMYSNTSFAPCVLVFDRHASGRDMRMADLSDCTVRAGNWALAGRYGTRTRTSKTLDLERSLEILRLPDPFARSRNIESTHSGTIDRHWGEPLSKLVRQVPFEELLSGDCNLQPSRYLQPPLKLSGHRRSLKELVDVIRAPVPTSDPYAIDAIEIGIPDLGGWRPVRAIAPAPDNQVRVVQVREKRLEGSELREGDIVMSVKGAVGRTALIGQGMVMQKKAETASGTAWFRVTSGNCVALRLRSDDVSPEYLLMYFRSREFEHQRDALLVGAVIPHITPDVLCDSVQIPIPSPVERARMQEKYQRLCDLEDQVEAAKAKIAAIVDGLWSPQL
jgi:type I restriction-modification system DNA methylase subunit